MQQLETYKLKHIGRDDAFGPDALNANTDAIAEQLARLDAADAAEAARVDAALDTKAAQTALDAGLAALARRVESLEAGQLRFKFGQYTGDGTSGSKNPNRLEFDFKPMVVIVHAHTGTDGGYPWVRGQYNSYTAGTVQSVILNWGENTVEWYNNGSEKAQLNTVNVVYDYIAIGIAE